MKDDQRTAAEAADSASTSAWEPSDPENEQDSLTARFLRRRFINLSRINDALEQLPPSIVAVTVRYSGDDAGTDIDCDLYDEDRRDAIASERELTPIKHLALDLVEMEHPCWRRTGDGGSGEVTFDIRRRTISLDHTRWFTSSEDIASGYTF